MSEIFGAVAAIIFFVVEKELIDMDGANMYNVTFAGNSTLNYMSPFCLGTCPNFNVNNGEPPTEVVSRLQTLGVIATVLVIRMACLCGELWFLDSMRTSFDKQGAVAPISSNSDAGENAATHRADRTVHAAANVFEKVSLPFLLVSFYGAMNSVALGLRVSKWTPTSDGVTVEFEG